MPRLYLPSSGVPSISPPYSAGWNITTDADRVLGQYASDNPHLTYPGFQSFTTPMTDKVINVASGSSSFYLARQFVYDPPCAPQLLKYNCSAVGSIRIIESDALINATLATGLRLVAPDSTVRSIVWAMTSTDSEASAVTLTSRNCNNTAGNPNISIRAGDRWVLEVGCKLSSSTAAGTVTFRFGWMGGADLPQNNTDTTDNNPWFMYRNAVDFYDYFQDGVSIENYRSVKVGDGMSAGERIR
jgi:hypothetical protein